MHIGPNRKILCRPERYIYFKNKIAVRMQSRIRLQKMNVLFAPACCGLAFKLFLMLAVTDVPLEVRARMWRMRDGTPAHFSHAVLQVQLSELQLRSDCVTRF
jgi:hypothetical protein